jgi:hypothetical protein
LDGKTAKKQIIYLSETDRANILSAVNSGTVNEIIEILNRYKTNFELTQTDSVISGIAGVIHARKPYASWTALVSEINYAVSTLDGLNKRVWSNLTDFLKNNPVIIDGTDADYIYYKALAQKEQNLINQKIIKALPFDSFEIFRTVFSASVAEYKTETSQNNSDNGKGGFTGSSGGGGSSFGFDKSITGFLRETPIEAAEIFNDLAFAEWARESVTALYEAGVISKAADKKFRPLDNVTREEFVKILVLSLGLSPGADFAVFSDTENGAWYNAYINAAKENGIVNGYPDGTFGTGLEITREDMAVMAFRAASVLGKSLNSAASEAAEFTDGNEISDYARDAVSLMKAAGILSGMGDGGFAPKETATRAQAAKMAASLISAVKGE